MSSVLWASYIRRTSSLTSAVKRCSWKQPYKASTKRFESSAATPGSPQFKAKKESLISPFMFLVGLVPIFTFALGTWQVKRLKWKVNLIDELQERLDRDPMSLPKHINLTAIPDFTYRKVILRGKWDHKHALLLGPRVHDGQNGYHVVEPLMRKDGTTILVDRGFIAKERVDILKELKDEGEVEILGMLRTAQVRNNFTPDNHPEKGEWYWADVEAMAEHAGGAKAGVQPVFVEEVFEGHAGEAASRIVHGIPVGRPAVVDMRNSHVSYIVTWYSLSAFTTVMFIRLLLKQRQVRARLPR